MTLTIRPATLDDLPALLHGNSALAHETESKTLHETTLRRGLEATFADPNKGFYTVAESEGRVVGHMLITLDRKSVV